MLPLPEPTVTSAQPLFVNIAGGLTASLQFTSRADGALAVIGEMLDRLESVTRPGQLHLMRKIVAVLGAHPLAVAGGPIITRRLEELRREAAKVAPDGHAFVHAAHALLATLTATRTTR